MSTVTQPAAGITIYLSDFPDFQALLARVDQQEREIEALKSRQFKWVTDEQAQQITGLSRGTLRSARKAPDSVIIYKEDHGLRYDYDSLLAHNAKRALGRGCLAKMLAQ